MEVKRRKYTEALQNFDVQKGGALVLRDLPRESAFKNKIINCDIQATSPEKQIDLIKYLYYLHQNILNKVRICWLFTRD